MQEVMQICREVPVAMQASGSFLCIVLCNRLPFQLMRSETRLVILDCL